MWNERNGGFRVERLHLEQMHDMGTRYTLRPRRLAFTLLLLTSSIVRAGSPSLGVILPRGAQRGTEMVANFHGARLENPRGVLFYRTGITLGAIESVNANHVKCTFTIAADAPLGVHPMRLVTASGVSELRLFSVGNCPEIVEIEPNSDRGQPQKIATPITVNGTITSEDVDYFAFDVAAGQRINIEIEAIRLGDTLFDPHLAVLDKAGAVLASADDTPLTKQDAVISHTFETAGEYVIEVREASYRGNGKSRYRLHVGDFPRPQGVLPPGGAPGEEIEVRWIGDAKLSTQKLTLPAAPLTGEFGLTAVSETGVSPTPVPFRLNGLAQTLEVEPNNAAEQATPCAVPGAASGVLSENGDVDWFRFSAKKGQALDFRVYGRALRSPIDSVMGLHKFKGAGLASNDDSGGPDSAFRFSIPEDGEYAFYVHDLLRRGGELYTYRVEVTPVAPSLTLSAAVNQQHVAVPKGNRNAILITARRGDFGGPLRIEMKDLPPGLAQHGFDMHASVGVRPIVLEATADAEMSARLIVVHGRHADESKNISGGFTQTIRLSAYRNSTMCSATIYKLPVAVSQAVPFKVRIVQPAAPLTRRGQMDVRIVAERGEGFTQPIGLRVLWNPPGVGSGTATIPGDKTEAAVRINANGGAALGDWPLVVVATADVGGAVQVSSQLATLTIIEAYVDFALEQTRVTQGLESEMVVKLTRNDLAKIAPPSAAPPASQPASAPPPKVTARVELRGLPGGVSVPLGEIDKETPEVRFALKAAPDARVGRHGGVFVHTEVMVNGEPVRFNSANGLLIVDKPLPPKKNAPPKPAQAKPTKKEEKKKRIRLPRRPDVKPIGAAKP